MEQQENFGEMTLETSDDGNDPGYLIYVYNLLSKEHFVQQPPLFPNFHIPLCPKGQKFSFTVLPAFVREPYVKFGTFERYYKRLDGRKAAASLLNPSCFPGVSWEAQLQKWDNAGWQDQFGNNLNNFGVWWSLTKPTDVVKLEREIQIFKAQCTKTMEQFVKQAELLATQGPKGLEQITPWMHFAMDYFGKQAAWHMASYHMIACPNCGETVMEGIAYHRNAFGERCVIDPVRYAQVVQRQREAEQLQTRVAEVQRNIPAANLPTNEMDIPDMSDAVEVPKTMTEAEMQAMAHPDPEPEEVDEDEVEVAAAAPTKAATAKKTSNPAKKGRR
jgi:hypothetical protein